MYRKTPTSRVDRRKRKRRTEKKGGKKNRRKHTEKRRFRKERKRDDDYDYPKKYGYKTVSQPSPPTTPTIMYRW